MKECTRIARNYEEELNTVNISLMEECEPQVFNIIQDFIEQRITKQECIGILCSLCNGEYYLGLTHGYNETLKECE